MPGSQHSENLRMAGALLTAAVFSFVDPATSNCSCGNPPLISNHKLPISHWILLHFDPPLSTCFCIQECPGIFNWPSPPRSLSYLALCQSKYVHCIGNTANGQIYLCLRPQPANSFEGDLRFDSTQGLQALFQVSYWSYSAQGDCSLFDLPQACMGSYITHCLLLR